MSLDMGFVIFSFGGSIGSTLLLMLLILKEF
jgi:hypothetical protein